MRRPALSVVRRSRDPRGQILPLTALMMVVLIGVTGLAIDVSSALLTQRFERAVADASSLAGAQDLQRAGSRALPGATEQGNARSHAMQVLVAQLGASSTPSTAVGSPCLTAAGCPLPGTSYTVSIQTPSPSCVDCVDNPDLAVQVAVSNPSFGLTFSRVLGQSQWRVAAASVAAIVHPRQYSVVVLRPPRPRRSGGDVNQEDIFLTGFSVINVRGGDIGTNTNMIYSCDTCATVNLDPGHKVFYYDPPPQGWLSPPPGAHVTTLILDPGYRIPQRDSTPVYNTIADARDATVANPLGDATGGNCASERLKVPIAYTLADGTPIQTMPANKVFCFKPGVYNMSESGSPPGLVNSDKTQAFLLEPGVYFFDKGLNSSSTVIGGYEGGVPGVALVFPEANTPTGQLQGNSSDLLALNFGSAYRNLSGTRATAAAGPQGLVQTSSTPPVLMSIIVVPDPLCYVAPTEPAGCNDNQNKTLNLPGNGNLWVAGVQYAPSDNVTVNGNNSATTGTFGQVVAWTVKYAGGAQLNLETANARENGVLRLDVACSPGASVCNP